MKSCLSKALCLGFLTALLWSPVVSSAYGKPYRSKSGDNYHFGFLYGLAGYNCLQTSLTNVTPSGSIGGSAGIGYEFRYKGFWISLGAGGHLHRSTLSLNEYSETHPGLDTQGKEVIFHYDILSQKDNNQWLMVEVPLMLGYYIKGFYVGVGPKLGFVMQPNIVSQGEYKFSGFYPMYNSFLEHDYYKTYSFEETNTIPTNPLVSVCAELGYDILSSVGTTSAVCHVLKIGGYFEYGINSVVRPSSTAMYLTIDPMEAQTAHPSSYLGGLTDSKRVVPFLVGLKLTYMIGGSRHSTGTYHRGCMCYQQ